MASDPAKQFRDIRAKINKQVPFVLATAINDLAFQVQAAEAKAIKDTFVNPRPFTQKATLVTKATKTSLQANVFIKPSSVPYIAPYEFGGQHHVPGRGLAIVDPVNLKLDQYGQIRGRPRNIADRPNTFVGAITFKKSGETVSGIWQRPTYGARRDGGRGTKGVLRTINGVKTGLKLLARFTDTTDVHKHLDFIKRAHALAIQKGPTAITKAIERALATMK